MTKKDRKKAKKIAVGGHAVDYFPDAAPLVPEPAPLKAKEEQVQMEKISEIQDDSTASTAASVVDGEEENKYFEPVTPYNSDADQMEQHEDKEKAYFEANSDEEADNFSGRITSVALLTKNFAFKSVKNFAITYTVISVAWFPAVCIGFWTGVVTMAVPAARPVVKQGIVNLESKMIQALKD